MKIRAALFFLGFLAVAAASSVLYGLTVPGPLTESRIVYVPRAVRLASLATSLERQGVIRNAHLFRFYGRLTGLGKRLRAGEFEIPAHATVPELAGVLVNGKIYARKVTIPEGVTNWSIADILNREKYLSGKIEAMPEEGSLLPDTYFYIRGDSRQGLIARMRTAQKAFIAGLSGRFSPPAPLKTVRQTVILASIIEEESVPGEQARVAGVFINRLREGMRLQTDPSIIYGLTQGKPLGRALTYADKRSETPWNTYVIDGLPPTPIANPGRAALTAAFNPEPHDYLYFVADGKGGSVFSATLSGHNANVRAYLAWLKQQKKDAPGGRVWQRISRS